MSRWDGQRNSGSGRSPLTDFSLPEFRCRFILPSRSRVSPRLTRRGRVRPPLRTSRHLFAPLLEGLVEAGVDLAHTVITADALHTQRAHAQYLHECGAGFVFTVKHNQPGLFAALDALSRSQTPTAARDIDTSHAPGHHPHHPGAPRPHRPTIPARQPGLADRTLHHQPDRYPTVRGRGTGRDQPTRPPRHPRTPRQPRPPTLGY